MKTLWLLVLTVLGCAPAPYTYVSDCVTIDSEIVLYQNKVDLYVGKAMELFDGKFGNGEFCKAATGTNILVRDAKTWTCFVDQLCIGFTDAFGDVTLNTQGSAFVHELIHVHELKQGKLDTGLHERWNYLGYRELDEKFQKNVTPLPYNSWTKP